MKIERGSSDLFAYNKDVCDVELLFYPDVNKRVLFKSIYFWGTVKYNLITVKNVKSCHLCQISQLPDRRLLWLWQWLARYYNLSLKVFTAVRKQIFNIRHSRSKKGVWKQLKYRIARLLHNYLWMIAYYICVWIKGCTWKLHVEVKQIFIYRSFFVHFCNDGTIVNHVCISYLVNNYLLFVFQLPVQCFKDT